MMNEKLSMLNELLNQIAIIRYMYDNLQYMENDYYFPHVPPYPHETSDVSCVNIINSYIDYMECVYNVRLFDATVEQPYLYKMKLLLDGNKRSPIHIDDVTLITKMINDINSFKFPYAKMANIGKAGNLSSILLNRDCSELDSVINELQYLGKQDCKDVIIFARHFENSALATIVANTLRGIMNINAVAVPRMLTEDGYDRLFQAIKIRTGGTVFTSISTDFRLEDFGHVKSFVADDKKISFGVV